MSLVMILSTAITAWGLWNFLALLLNYNAARHIGLPVIIGPFSPMNPFWILATRTLPIVRLLNSSPFGLGKWTRCTYMGWSFDDKCALHKELGRAFTLVTPGSNEVWIADPDAAHAVLSRRKEYVKPRAMYGTKHGFSSLPFAKQAFRRTVECLWAQFKYSKMLFPRTLEDTY